MSVTVQQKADLRRACAARRRAAHEAGAGAAARAARDRFLAEGFQRGARIASGYRPIRSEIDPTPLMEALAGAGLRLCLPVIEGAGRPLRFREWRPGAALQEGPFGAEVPAAGDWLEPDLLIVPLLGFDSAGHRLGYGGGFYDRTLAGLRRRGNPVAVGLAFEAQRVEALPAEPTDQPLDAVVTEAGALRPALV